MTRPDLTVAVMLVQPPVPTWRKVLGYAAQLLALAAIVAAPRPRR